MAVSQITLVSLVVLEVALMISLVLVVYLRGKKREFPQRKRNETLAWTGDVIRGASSRFSHVVQRPGVPSEKIDHTPWASLYKRIGSKSKLAGLVFAILTTGLLILSTITQFIVFEIDSIIAFLATLVLLFSEPRKTVQARVIDAVLDSSERSIADLAAREADSFEYLPEKDGIAGVVMVPVAQVPVSQGKLSLVSGGSRITPPGRALAVLFAREAGVSTPSIDSLEASLPRIMTENFGLANSVMLSVDDASVRVLLGSPSFECPCSADGLTAKSGVPGCTVASFLAVLVCASTRRPLMLEGCARDAKADTWEVRMKLGIPEAQV